MLESLFNKFADIKSEILLDERLHHGYFSMKKFHLKKTFLTAGAVVRKCSKKEGFLWNFAKFTGKHLSHRVFLNKGTGVFLWIVRHFYEHLFLQNTSGGYFFNMTSPDDCFWYLKNLTFKLSILTIQF